MGFIIGMTHTIVCMMLVVSKSEFYASVDCGGSFLSYLHAPSQCASKLLAENCTIGCAVGGDCCC